MVVNGQIFLIKEFPLQEGIYGSLLLECGLDLQRIEHGNRTIVTSW